MTTPLNLVVFGLKKHKQAMDEAIAKKAERYPDALGWAFRLWDLRTNDYFEPDVRVGIAAYPIVKRPSSKSIRIIDYSARAAYGESQNRLIYVNTERQWASEDIKKAIKNYTARKQFQLAKCRAAVLQAESAINYLHESSKVIDVINRGGSLSDAWL